MAIIAAFPEGVTSLTVNGLHQWDYGRTLEIHDPTLPALVEVHFGYMGAREAVVRSCSAASGVATVAIPDVCLEQPSAVTAWVYAVGETTGRTIRTVVMPLVARTRPAALTDQPPEDVSNKYTEALAAMNATVNDLQFGGITVANAMEASFANSADHASSADHATTAEGLQYPSMWTSPTATRLTAKGVYILQFPVPYSYKINTVLVCHEPANQMLNHFFVDVVRDSVTGNMHAIRGRLDSDGQLTLEATNLTTGATEQFTSKDYQYRCIAQ